MSKPEHISFEVKAGQLAALPVGTLFQFRTEGNSALECVIGTFPRCTCGEQGGPGHGPLVIVIVPRGGGALRRTSAPGPS